MKNASIFVLLTSLFFVGCCNQIKILGTSTSHFNNEQLKEIRKHYDFKKIMSEMIIGSIIVDENQKIGLYKCLIYKKSSSINVIYKFLKFKTRIAFYSKFADENEKNLTAFEIENKNHFSPEEFKKIRDSFLRGVEISGLIM
jgi:hypothetical protein